MRGGSVGLAASGAAAVIASFVAGKAARDAILLSNFEVTSLPLFVGIAATLSIPLVLVTGRLMVRFGPARLMTVLNALSAALLIGEWIVFASSPRVAAVVVFFHLSSFGAVLVSGFWSIVNERFDARTARLHIGRIGMAATIGGIAGGIVAERAAVLLEPGMILLVLAVLQAACAVVAYALGDRPIRPSATETPGVSALKQVARSSLLRNLAFVLVFDAIAAAALDYVFKAEVTAAAGPDNTLRFFAIFYTASSVITAVVQLAAARPTIERLGVARAIGTLPATLIISGLGAFAAPGLMSTVLARGGEIVMRSTLYRVAYELMYAPMLEQKKRSTKVVLDVGIERIGDLLGAQLIGLLLYVAPEPRAWLLVTVAVAGLLALVFAARLPRGYTSELEHSLRTRSQDPPPAQHTMIGWPTLGDAGDLTAMSLLDLRHAPADRIAALRSDDPIQIRAALTDPLPVELAAIVVPLVGRDDVAAAAIAALRVIAPRSTGTLLDALLDPLQAPAVRQRLPAILAVGEPALAAWGLWRGLADPRFDVRYRCARALARMAIEHEPEEVFAIVKREIADPEVWRSHGLVDAHDDANADDQMLQQVMQETGLEHIFTLLGLALPADPLRIALQALYTDDQTLRGTALEYLESVLPGDVRSALWPRVEPTEAPRTAVRARPRAEIVANLQLTQPLILAHLKARPKPTVRGEIDWNVNKDAVRAHKTAIRKLFETTLKSSPHLAGRYVLQLTIASSGAITSAEVTQHPAGTGVAVFNAALVAEAMSWRFAESSAEAVINYPFVFEPTK